MDSEKGINAVPDNVNEFFASYPDAYKSLCRLRNKLATTGTGPTDAPDVADLHTGQTAHDDVANLFVLQFDDIRRKWDAARSPNFYRYCFTMFAFYVTRQAADLARSNTRRDSPHRHKARVARESDFVEFDLNATPCPEVNEVASYTEEQRSVLSEALTKIDPELSFIVWNRINGFTVLEIAERLKMSRSTVSDRYRRGLEELRTIVQKQACD